MLKSKYFEREIELIQNEEYKSFVREYLDEYVPDYFWEIGASSSGRYHPKFSQGEGGLVRHTKAVVMFAEELLRMSSYMYMSEEHKDFVIMACILHDTCKYGMRDYEKEEYKNHARNAEVLVDGAWADYFGSQCSEFFLSAIRCHMGQWSEREDRPFTNIDRCVHMADYMASRNFIDIPQINEEYHNTFIDEMADSYELIDDPLCDLDDNIPAMENCLECEHLLDCKQKVVKGEE